MLQLIVLLTAAIAAPAFASSDPAKVSVATFDTKDFDIRKQGLAKIEWDDHWFEAQNNSDGTQSIWLVQRFSYDGEMRFYDRGNVGTSISQRPMEVGGRLVDDCRKVGPFERCRRAELARMPITAAELAQLATASETAVAEFYGMTRKPYKAKIEAAEAARMFQMLRIATPK